MNEFTASNGVAIRHDEDGDLEISGLARNVWEFLVNPAGIQALREFFLHERDEALGRWRHPEHPGVFAAGFSDDPDVVQIVKEENGTAYAQYQREETGPVYDMMHRVAVAYFAAHPKPTKPAWHDAKLGEVWVLAVTDLTAAAAYLAGDLSFMAADHSVLIEDTRITSAHRIYPA